MVDKINIELDGPFLTSFFGITEKIIPDGQEITLLMMRKQLEEITILISDLQEQLKDAKVHSASGRPTAPIPATSSVPSAPSSNIFDGIPSYGFDDDKSIRPQSTFNNVLIIDDLGVITYQLDVLFKQAGYEVATSKEIYDAIEKFKKRDFDLVIMDLFIPTEREGFILLEELKKTANSRRKNVKIGVMSASARKEHKQLCKMKGAAFYIEKTDEWQKNLFTAINELK